MKFQKDWKASFQNLQGVKLVSLQFAQKENSRCSNNIVSDSRDEDHDFWVAHTPSFRTYSN